MCILTEAISWVLITSCAVIWVLDWKKGEMFRVTPSGSRSSSVTPLLAITVSPLSNSNFRKPLHSTISWSERLPLGQFVGPENKQLVSSMGIIRVFMAPYPLDRPIKTCKKAPEGGDIVLQDIVLQTSGIPNPLEFHTCQEIWKISELPRIHLSSQNTKRKITPFHWKNCP